MKKITLTSIALATLVASTAFADNVQVGAGGSVQFDAGVRSQTKAYQQNASVNQKTGYFNSKAKAYLKAVGKNDNGLVYGAVAGLHTTAMNNATKQLSNTNDRTYLFLESAFGRIELGSNYSAAKQMKVDAGSVARATGGTTDGVWTDVVSFAGMGAANPYDATFYMGSDLLTDYVSGVAGNAEEMRRVSYFTPRMNGFQFGLSYAPDSTNNGSGAVRELANANAPFRDFKNVINGGVNFTQQYDQLTLSLSALGETGQGAAVLGADTPGVKHKLQSYSFGGSLTYANFALAASYGATTKKSLAFDVATPVNNRKGSHFWTAGASYVQGPMGASLTYLNSNHQRNRLKAVAVGVDFAAAEGLKLYAEDTFFRARSSTLTQAANKGSVFVVGSQLSF